MKKKLFLLFLILLPFSSFLRGVEEAVSQEEDYHVSVDLVDPIFEDGILSTEKGGILLAPNLRIQACKITYTRQFDACPPAFKVKCEGSLLVDYKDKTLVGDSLEFDFITHTGTIINGKTSMPPWNISGEQIILEPEGGITICNGYLTTNDGGEKDLMIGATSISIVQKDLLSAKNVNIRIGNVPIFWIPSIKLDLSNDCESPFEFTFNWGGFLGTRIGIRYKAIDWHDFKGYLRVDGYVTRGLGGGIETEYAPCNSCQEFYTRNYYAHDISIDDRKRRDRYRFEGTYYNLLWQDQLSIDLKYDKVSDAEMAADYPPDDFDLKTAGRTQLEFRTICDDWMADLFTSVRVNSFQTINQALPDFEISWRPSEIGSSGIIFDNPIEASYFNYVFASEILHEHNFKSTRFELTPRILPPLLLGTCYCHSRSRFSRDRFR